MSRFVLAALTMVTLAACSGGGGSSATSGSGPGSTGQYASSSGSGGASATSGGASTGGSASGGVSGSSAGSTTGIPLNAATFDQAFNTAYCESLFRCYEWAPYVAAICSQGAIRLVDDADLPLAIDAGRADFDAAQAAVCIGELQDAGCRANALESCTGVIVGNVQSGGACYSGPDCTNGDCENNSLGQCKAGACSATVGLGAACDCTGCGTCDLSIGLVCSNSICAPAGGPGADCSGNAPPCAPGLTCVAGSCTTTPVPHGSACNADEGDCANGAYCLVVDGGTIGTCETQDSLGSPCGQDPEHSQNAFETLDNQCAGVDSVCAGAGFQLDGGLAAGVCSHLGDVGAKCVPPGPAIDTAQEYIEGCYVYLNCVGGTCKKPPSSGVCSTGLHDYPCNPVTAFCDDGGNCHAFTALGGNCIDDQQCGIGAQCNGNGVCETNSSCSPQL